MGKKMLFYVLFACFLPLMTAEEAVTTVKPVNDQEKQKPDQNPTVMAAPPEPGAALNAKATTEKTLEMPVQNSEAANTTSATNGVPSSTVKPKERLTPVIESNNSSNVAAQENKTFASPSQSTLNETQNENTNNINTTEVPTSVPISGALPTKVDEQDASSAPTNENAPPTTSTLAVTSARPNTEVVPTAKIPATTQVPTTVQKITLSSTTKIPTVPTPTPRKPVVPTPTPRKPVVPTPTPRKPVVPTPTPRKPVVPTPTPRKPVVPTPTTRKPVVPTESFDAPKADKQGKIVAGLIGGALIFMILGFLLILYKKHKLKKQQIATNDWAGPTPFLETGGGSNGPVTLRSSTKISLTSFLPQRLSKRMTLLGENGEEMQDMQELTTGTTFVAKEEKSKEVNDKKVEKTEKTEKPASQGTNENSKNSTQIEDLVLVNETKENGEAKSKELENGQAITNEGEKGQSENKPAQPATVEEPPKEQNNEKQE